MTKEPSATPSNQAARPLSFPKRSRILKSSDFRTVYSQGFRMPGRCFTAFCLALAEQDGPRVGFTVPRAVGKAVYRNRIRRRLRECVRLQLAGLDAKWSVVFNPRRTILTAPMEELRTEVQKVLQRCSGQ